MTSQAQTNGSFMPEKDLLYTILADLKRTVREYATATTESSCPTVRQMFGQLTSDALRLQGELYTLMKNNNMYSAASPALRQELDKQIQSVTQTQQEAKQFVQQKLGNQGQFIQPPNVSEHQPNVQNPYIM